MRDRMKNKPARVKNKPERQEEQKHFASKTKMLSSIYVLKLICHVIC